MSFDINNDLREWLISDICNVIQFVWVPSHEGFPLNKHTDNSIKEPFIGPPPPIHQSPASAIWLHKASAISSWHAKFAVFQAMHPITLKKKQKALMLSAWNPASHRFLNIAGQDQEVITQFTRAITGHAPTGEYRLRFFPDQPFHCPCGAPIQTRDHILHECPRYVDRLRSLTYIHKGSNNFKQITEMIKANVSAFTFEDAPPTIDLPP